MSAGVRYKESVRLVLKHHHSIDMVMIGAVHTVCLLARQRVTWLGSSCVVYGITLARSWHGKGKGTERDERGCTQSNILTEEEERGCTQSNILTETCKLLLFTYIWMSSWLELFSFYDTWVEKSLHNICMAFSSIIHEWKKVCIICTWIFLL